MECYRFGNPIYSAYIKANLEYNLFLSSLMHPFCSVIGAGKRWRAGSITRWTPLTYNGVCRYDGKTSAACCTISICNGTSNADVNRALHVVQQEVVSNPCFGVFSIPLFSLLVGQALTGASTVLSQSDLFTFLLLLLSHSMSLIDTEGERNCSWILFLFP